MGSQIGDVAKRNAQSNRQKIPASISSPPADSGTSHTTKKAAENVPRRGYNFYIQLEATPGIMPPMQYWEVIADKLSAAGAPFALLVFVVASAFAKSTAPEVIFISPCECEGFHGKNRWIAKTDFTPVPLDKSAIQGTSILGSARVASDEAEILHVPAAELRRALAEIPAVSTTIVNALIMRRRRLNRDREFAGFRVLAAGEDRDGHQIDDFLDKNHIPHRVIDAESAQGQETMKRFRLTNRDLTT